MSTSERPPLPPELADALAELLAQALVAELLEARKVAQTQGEVSATVVSPPGLNRKEVN